MNKSRLSLIDTPYNEQNDAEAVYTSAFNKPKKERDGFIAKVRGNIHGVIRKVREKQAIGSTDFRVSGTGKEI